LEAKETFSAGMKKDYKTLFFLSSTKALAIAFSVAALTIIIYLPVLHNDFVNWDDDEYIYKNPYIQSVG
jgi:hypothetical protein